jgi:DNA invertase Pin-like site-specific DNA recombinase
MFAEFETKLRRGRQLDRIAKAKAKGVCKTPSQPDRRKRNPDKTVGERAILAAMGMLAQCGELRARDRLTIRLSIEWEDAPPDNLDEPDLRRWISTR